MGEVTTVGKTETHHSVLGVDESSESGKASVYMSVAEEINMQKSMQKDSLGGGTRVRLDVDAPDLGVKVESLQSTLPGKVLDNVDELQK